MIIKLLVLLGFTFLLSISSYAGLPVYRLIKEIPLEHKEGGWDYLSIDSISRRIYLTQATRVIVMDIDQYKIVGEISDTPGIHGFSIAAELGRGFSSNGKESKVSIIDLATLKTLIKVPTGENPDAILYNSIQKEVYAFNGKDKSVTVIQAKTGKVEATINLPGKPEFSAFEAGKNRVLVNIEDKNLVEVIDSISHKAVAEWSLTPGDEPTGMDIDQKLHRLFIGCHNQVLLMLDTNSGKVIKTVPIGKGVDAVVYDPGTGMVFSSNGDGTVSIAHENGIDSLDLIQTLKTEVGARTMALDLKTHRIFLLSAKYEKVDAKIEHQRPKIVPGSLKLLVYGY